MAAAWPESRPLPVSTSPAGSSVDATTPASNSAMSSRSSRRPEGYAGAATQPPSSRHWLNRAAVWGIGAAVPVVCVLGLWLLATARGGGTRVQNATHASLQTLAAAPLDTSVPPSIELRRERAPATEAETSAVGATRAVPVTCGPPAKPPPAEQRARRDGPTTERCRPQEAAGTGAPARTSRQD